MVVTVIGTIKTENMYNIENKNENSHSISGWSYIKSSLIQFKLYGILGNNNCNVLLIN